MARDRKRRRAEAGAAPDPPVPGIHALIPGGASSGPRQGTRWRALRPGPRLGALKRFVVAVWRESDRDDIFNGAATLAFYLTLAIFPAMIFLMAIIPYLPIARVDEAILDLLRQALPASAADMFADVVTNITRERRGGLLSLALAGALWAASTGMYAVMQQLNLAFDVVERRPFLRARAVALVLTVLYGALVLTAFSLVVLGGVIQDWIGQRHGYSSALLNFFIVFRWVVIALALLVALAGVYYAAPNRQRPFALVTPGTLTAAVLLIAASLGFKLYAANFANYDAMYGSIGAVIVLMLWLYLAGLAMLVGAEIDALRARGRERGPALTAAEKAKHVG